MLTSSFAPSLDDHCSLPVLESSEHMDSVLCHVFKACAADDQVATPDGKPKQQMSIADCGLL